MKNRVRSCFVITLIILVSFGLLSGCSSDKSKSESKKMVDENISKESTSSSGYNATDSDSSKNADSKAIIYNNRKIIKNAKLNVETKKYTNSIRQLESLVNQSNGYIENSDVNGEDSNKKQKRSARYTVRIPTEQLDSFLNSVGTIGKITQKSLTGTDITEQYFDKESRLNALKIEQASLEDFLKKAANVKDSLDIYTQLTRVNTDIEQITGEMQKLNQLVSLSKIDISLNEVHVTKVYKDNSFMGEVKNIFVDSSRAMITFCGGIIKFLVAIIPFAFVFGVVGYIGYFIYKKIKTIKIK